MSTKGSKTIDNLGVDASIRYSQDQQDFDEIFIRDSKRVALGSQLDILTPIYYDETSLLLDLRGKATPWAILAPPEHYNEQKKRLFNNQLGSAFGPEELLEMQETRIEEARDSFTKEDEKDEEQKDKKKLNWEKDKENEEVTKQAKKLLDLMQDINFLNKIIELINSERYRYNKG